MRMIYENFVVKQNTLTLDKEIHISRNSNLNEETLTHKKFSKILFNKIDGKKSILGFTEEEIEGILSEIDKVSAMDFKSMGPEEFKSKHMEFTMVWFMTLMFNRDLIGTRFTIFLNYKRVKVPEHSFGKECYTWFDYTNLIRNHFFKTCFEGGWENL